MAAGVFPVTSAMHHRRQIASDRVEEMQGLFGPYAFPEKLLQKIWLLGRFERHGALLDDGRSLDVLAPGRWNLLGGPDFRAARLRIAGREVEGDVEVHFHSADWVRHGHDRDPAYDAVVLHVVLHESPRDRPVLRTASGREIPQLVLLPWLHCNLEEFAADAAVEALTGRDAMRLAETLLELPAPERASALRAAAERRWAQKRHFAAARIERLGWEGACHCTALEILGYSLNRAAMLSVAERLPLAAWRAGGDEAAALVAGGDLWRYHGVRPANSPRTRLAQYRAWVAAVPDWPERWLGWGSRHAAPVPAAAGEDVAAARRRHGLSGWWREVASRVVGGAVGGARVATLIGNGLLPLLAARTGQDLFGRWYCGPASEVPESMSNALRLAGVVGRGAAPRHEGAVQGLVQMTLDQTVPDW